MKTASDLFNFLRRQGTNRLRPLLLLLNTSLGLYTKVRDFEAAYTQQYHTPLQSWDLHVSHKQGLIEFKQLPLSAWVPIGDFLKGRLFDVDETLRRTYQEDAIRIPPVIYPLVKENRGYLLFRSTFYLYPRPVFLHKEILHQPVETLLRIGLALYQLFKSPQTVTYQEATRLLNTGFFSTWDGPLTPEQVQAAVLRIHQASQADLQITRVGEADFTIEFLSS